jgi:hypothetical protein
MPSLIYRNDIGARIYIKTLNTTMPIDTVLTVYIKKPSGTILTIIPSGGMIDFTTGEIEYPTVSGDVDEDGEYRVQVNAVFDDGDILDSNIASFTVYEKIM